MILSSRKIGITKVPAVQSRCGFRLNRSDSGFGLFVLVWIVPIPQRTLNIIGNENKGVNFD